jgi:hypothetical protein
MASAIATAPWLIALSRHKGWMFFGSGLLLSLNYWLVVVRPRQCAPGEPCHPDTPAMRLNRRLFWISVGVYAVALVITYASLLAVIGR